jgi:homoserine dehydrogenase
LKLILLGCGAVNLSLLEILLARRTELSVRYGLQPKIAAVVDSRGAAMSPDGLDIKELIRVKKSKGSVAQTTPSGRADVNALDVISEVDADMVVEAIPTNLRTGEPSLSYVKRALEAGRNVVTANKGPLALTADLLPSLANKRGLFFRFSGAVGGGTPILDLAARCSLGDRIVGFQGVFNGTTNYILSELEAGLSFEAALRAAKERGYAEADPLIDIRGLDSASKLVILSNAVFGTRMKLKNVKVKGIRGVTKAKVANAAAKGRVIRLIGSGGIAPAVAPQEIPRESPLAVNSAMNAVTFELERSGSITISGKGAGGKETAGALLRDILTIHAKLGGFYPARDETAPRVATVV